MIRSEHLVKPLSTACRFCPLCRKAATGEIEIDAEGGRRTLRSTCDWTEAAVSGEHLWMPTSASGDFCYVPEQDCCVSTAC